MRIAVITPSHTGYVSAAHADAKARTFAALGSKHEIVPFGANGVSSVTQVRNALTAAAMAWGADALFFIDDDVSWKPEQFFKILHSKRDIAAGMYPMKPNSPEQLDKVRPAMAIFTDRGPLLRKEDDGMVEIDACGAGFMRVNRSVFERLKAVVPHMKMHGYSQEPSIAAEHYGYFQEQYQPGTTGVGEDVFFCRTARSVGINTYCDFSCAVGHNLGPLEFIGRVPDELFEGHTAPIFSYN